MLANLAIGSTTVQVPLLKEKLGLELNECKELASGKLEKFSSQVSFKQFRKLLRKHKQPATVVVIRSSKSDNQSVSKMHQIEINNLEITKSEQASSSKDTKGFDQVFAYFLEMNGTKIDQFVQNEIFTLQ